LARLRIEVANRVVVEGTPPPSERTSHGNAKIRSRNSFEQRWTLKADLSAVDFIIEVHVKKTEVNRPERKCVVDLTGVTFIDRSGEKALAELSNKARNSSRPVFPLGNVVHNSERKSIVRGEERSTS